jgi:hypothetical protein
MKGEVSRSPSFSLNHNPRNAVTHFRHRPLIACTGILVFRLGITDSPVLELPLHKSDGLCIGSWPGLSRGDSKGTARN